MQKTGEKCYHARTDPGDYSRECFVLLNMKVIFFYVWCIFLFSCDSRSRGSLKYITVVRDEKNKDKTLSNYFHTPLRNPKKYDDWKYKFALVLKKDSKFDYDGIIKVFDTNNVLITKNYFDSMNTVKSSWLHNNTSQAWIIDSDIDLNDSERYRIDLEFLHNRPLESELVLFYVFHLQ